MPLGPTLLRWFPCGQYEKLWGINPMGLSDPRYNSLEIIFLQPLKIAWDETNGLLFPLGLLYWGDLIELIKKKCEGLIQYALVNLWMTLNHHWWCLYINDSSTPKMNLINFNRKTLRWLTWNQSQWTWETALRTINVLMTLGEITKIDTLATTFHITAGEENTYVRLVYGPLTIY